jgi:hypothetical protein
VLTVLDLRIPLLELVTVPHESRTVALKVTELLLTFRGDNAVFDVNLLYC